MESVQVFLSFLYLCSTNWKDMQEIKTITQYRESLRTKILESAMTLFTSHGIKAVKMDDIARQLNISKRTLYEIYENKEALLYEGVKAYKMKKDREFQRLLIDCQNVMDIILKIYYIKVDESKNISPLFYEDLSKYPSVMTFLNEDRVRQNNRSLQFVQRGIREGCFRSDIDLGLLSKMHEAVAQFIMNGEIYKSYSVEEIFRTIVFVSLRGICTRKGLELLEGIIKDGGSH